MSSFKYWYTILFLKNFYVISPFSAHTYTFPVIRSTSVSSPGETMPRSDSADSQSQAIQEEPLPSTSNDDEDPLAGKMFYDIHQQLKSSCYLIVLIILALFRQVSVSQRVWTPLSWLLFQKTFGARCCKINWASDHLLVRLLPPLYPPLHPLSWGDKGLLRSALSS